MEAVSRHLSVDGVSSVEYVPQSFWRRPRLVARLRGGILPSLTISASVSSDAPDRPSPSPLGARILAATSQLLGRYVLRGQSMTISPCPDILLLLNVGKPWRHPAISEFPPWPSVGRTDPAIVRRLLAHPFSSALVPASGVLLIALRNGGLTVYGYDLSDESLLGMIRVFAFLSAAIGDTVSSVLIDSIRT